MAEWERRERHEVVWTGPPQADAVEMIRLLHEAMSDWRQFAGKPPSTELPPGAVSVACAGGVLSVRIEVAEYSAAEPARMAMDVAEPEDQGDGRG